MEKEDPSPEAPPPGPRSLVVSAIVLSHGAIVGQESANSIRDALKPSVNEFRPHVPISTLLLDEMEDI